MTMTNNNEALKELFYSFFNQYPNSIRVDGNQRVATLPVKNFIEENRPPREGISSLLVDDEGLVLAKTEFDFRGKKTTFLHYFQNPSAYKNLDSLYVSLIKL